LTSLTIGRTSIKDLSTLTPNLTTLSMSSIPIDNIEALEHLTKLVDLDISSNNIQDFSPISEMTELLSLTVNTMSPALGNQGLRDVISALNPDVRTVKFEGNEISDIGAVAKINQVVDLYFDDNPIKDLSVFSNADFSNLQSISLGGTLFEDLSPLASAQSLFFVNTLLSDAGVLPPIPLGTTIEKTEENCPTGAGTSYGVIDWCIR
jgi:internalin A